MKSKQEMSEKNKREKCKKVKLLNKHCNKRAKINKKKVKEK